MFEEITTELVQESHKYTMFVFSFINYIGGEKIKSYFFLRKTNEFIEHLKNDSMHAELQTTLGKQRSLQLIDDKDEVSVLVRGGKLISIPFDYLFEF